MKLDFSRTLVMGILNITPDSFSDGGNFIDENHAISHAERMVQEGADIIDIGGESTRPGAQKISDKEELTRVIPIIKKIRALFPHLPISIDTYKSVVAQQAIEAGATIINDVSGLQLDSLMPKIVASLHVPIIINHMRGTPQTMQEGAIVYKDLLQELSDFFAEKITLLEKIGAQREHIIIDPGFGFGKAVEHNILILQSLGRFKKFKLPILIGVSRKSTVGKLLQEAFGKEFSPKERLEASLAATAVAISNGASIIRTHDVLETKQFITVFDRIRTRI